ncbi:MAG TPA: hypothetical protein VG937_39880 [Polyangiaceae bacterium]|nr:hypothetical protein [Polyangiaceae bacterium]
MTALRSLTLGFVCLAPFLACSGNSGYGDAPGGSGLQVSVERQVGPPASQVLLLVVDDRAEAADLVAEVSRSLEALSLRPLEPQTNCRLSEDPGARHPIDWSAVIVHPSASGDAIYTSPADAPALRWAEQERTEAGRSAWIEAVQAALATSPEEPGPFAVLEAFQRAASLLTGQRAAVGPTEKALLESLPETAEVEVSLALGADDESPEVAVSYAVSLGSHGSLDTLVMPAAESGADSAACHFEQGETTPRLAEWLTAQGAGEWALWPCSSPTLFGRLVDDVNCQRQCVDFRPLQDDDGAAACLVLVDSATDACDESRGWLDPQGEDGVRRPIVTHTANGTLRTCEVRQLTGSALASCHSELSCAACEPGWCLTDVAELQVACTQKRPFPLRFVGGADVVAAGLATVICNATR